MLKTKQIEKTVTEEEIEDVICNKCRSSCKDGANLNYEGLIEIIVEGGYASKLGDGTSYVFSLCENCLAELFKTFLIEPTLNNKFGHNTDYDDFIIK